MVSVIILNYNGLQHDFLPHCLTSLYAQTYPNLEIIVVDNASTDESVCYVTEQFPQVRLLALPQNYGFCAGNNRGLALATGDYILFANNDTQFPPETIARLVTGMAQAPDIGLVSPKLLRPTPDLAGHYILDSAGLQLRPDFTLRDRGFGLPDVGQYDQPVFLFAACGATFFVRRAALESVMTVEGHCWDETFLAYYEDGDLSWRLQHQGWRCLYWPDAVVYHARGGSSASSFFQKPVRFKAHTITNRYLMLIKNVTGAELLSRLPYILIREGLIWGYLCLHPRLLLQVGRNLWQTVPHARQIRRSAVNRLRPVNVFAVTPAPSAWHFDVVKEG